MKRILGVLAIVALVAMTVQAVEVKSQNVAGVYTKTLPSNGGLIALAVQVDPFDSADATLEGVLGTDQLRAEVGKTQGADKVYMWNGTGYDIFWMKEIAGVNVWSDAGGATNPPVDSGTAFWIRSQNNQDDDLGITITGQAVENAEIVTPISAGLQMMAYPFSSGVAVNDTDFITDGASQESGKTTQSDKIYLWDPVSSGYTILKTVDGDNYWQVQGGGGGAATDVIGIGDGIWYEAQGSYSWGETNAYLSNL